MAMKPIFEGTNLVLEAYAIPDPPPHEVPAITLEVSLAITLGVLQLDPILILVSMKL